MTIVWKKFVKKSIIIIFQIKTYRFTVDFIRQNTSGALTPG